MKVQIYESQYWYILSMKEKRNPCMDNNLCNPYPQVSPSSSGPKPLMPSCLHGCHLVRWRISVMLPSLRNLRGGGSNVVPQERTPLATRLWLPLVKQIRKIPLLSFQALKSDPTCRRWDRMAIKSTVTYSVSLSKVLCLQYGTISTYPQWCLRITLDS